MVPNVTIEDFLRLLLRNMWLLLILTLLGLGLGYGYSYTKEPVFAARALGYVATSVEKDQNGNIVPTGANAPAGGEDAKYGTAQTFLPLFNTRAVGEQIKKKMNLDLPADSIAASLSASIDPNAPIITVEAYASTPQQAMEIANASIDAVNREGAFLQTGNRDSQDAPMKLIQYQTADGGGAQMGPDRKKFAAIGAGAGLLIALGLSWLRNRNDSRVRTVDDIKSKTPVPALGVIPETKDLMRRKDGTLPDPTTFHAKEALRKLRTNLRFANVDNPPRSIVVSSSAPGEGKSTVSGNLARVIARSGQKVVLIDADLRRPAVAKQFGVDGSVGLSQLIAGRVGFEDVMHTAKTRNLTIIPAGQIPPNPSELLGSQRMRDIVHTLSEDYFVIVDAPPILAVTDAVLLSRHTDGAILVAVPGRSRVEGLSRAIESVRAVNGTVLGVVMNRASTSRINRLAYGDAEYGYSSYGYSAYQTMYEPETGKKLKRKDRKNALVVEEPTAAEHEEIVPAVEGGAYGADGSGLGRRAQSSRSRATGSSETASPVAPSAGANVAAPKAQVAGSSEPAPSAAGSAASASPASTFPSASTASSAASASAAPASARRRAGRRGITSAPAPTAALSPTPNPRVQKGEGAE